MPEGWMMDASDASELWYKPTANTHSAQHNPLTTTDEWMNDEEQTLRQYKLRTSQLTHNDRRMNVWWGTNPPPGQTPHNTPTKNKPPSRVDSSLSLARAAARCHEVCRSRPEREAHGGSVLLFVLLAIVPCWWLSCMTCRSCWWLSWLTCRLMLMAVVPDMSLMLQW